MPRYTVQGRTFNAPSLDAALEAFEGTGQAPKTAPEARQPETAAPIEGVETAPTAENWRTMAGSPAGRMLFPAAGGLVGGFFGGGWGAAPGAGGMEALRQVIAGEEISPRKIGVETALGAVPKVIAKPLGALGKLIPRLIPGHGAAFQKGAVESVRGAVESLPAPSAEGAYNALKAYQGLAGTEQIAAPNIVSRATALADELQPLVAELKKSFLPAKQEAARKVAEGLRAAAAGRGGKFSVEEIQQLLERLGPETQKEFGKAGGAVKNLWGTIKQTLQEAADAGSMQAKMLLEAQQVHKRSEAVKGLKVMLEPSQEGAAIRMVEGTPGYEQVSGAKLLEALPPLRRTGELPYEVQRLAETLSPVEMKNLRAVFEKAAKAPKIRTGFASFLERLPFYMALAAGGYGVGGAQGLFLAGAGAEGLAQLARTPAGMKIVQRMATARLGQGTGTRAAQAVLPALGGLATP